MRGLREGGGGCEGFKGRWRGCPRGLVKTLVTVLPEIPITLKVTDIWLYCIRTYACWGFSYLCMFTYVCMQEHRHRHCILRYLVYGVYGTSNWGTIIDLTLLANVHCSVTTVEACLEEQRS